MTVDRSELEEALRDLKAMEDQKEDIRKKHKTLKSEHTSMEKAYSKLKTVEKKLLKKIGEMEEELAKGMYEKEIDTLSLDPDKREPIEFSGDSVTLEIPRSC